jgi:group I intron endonuclease
MLIYKIYNTITNQTYIGKTTKSLQERFDGHVYDSNSGSKTYLHRALRKYGVTSFTYEVIEDNVLEKNLDDREKYWIKTLDTLIPKGYNMTNGGEGGDTSNSPNWIEGMKNRKDMSGKNNPMYGKDRKGESRHPDTGKNISKGQKKNWENNPDRKTEASSRILGENNPMYGKTPSNAVSITFEGKTYKSITHAVRETGRSAKYIIKNGVKNEQRTLPLD